MSAVEPTRSAEIAPDIDGHVNLEPEPGWNFTCGCGTSGGATWENHVADAIRRKQQRDTHIDVCEHCGDIVVCHAPGHWSHYRGAGSYLNRCQMEPYGTDATPAHEGRYFRLLSEVDRG